MEQGSREWLLARAGKITASEMSSVMAGAQPLMALCLLDANGGILQKFGNGEKARAEARKAEIPPGGYIDTAVYGYRRGEGFNTLRDRIAAEMITMVPHEGGRSAAMRTGTEREPVARAAYELHTGHNVVQSGFSVHPVYTYVGASPDGLIPEISRGIEVKCPSQVVHMHTLLYGMPREHMPQVQANMWVHGYFSWDFISFCPEFSGRDMELYIETIERDESYISMMSALCSELHDEAIEIVARVKSKMGVA